MIEKLTKANSGILANKVNEIIDHLNGQQNADGCEGCKYQSKDEFEMPCLNCKRNKMDYWRAE